MHVSTWHRVGGAGLGVHLFFCALISAGISHHFTGHYSNAFGAFLLLLALCAFVAGIPGVKSVQMDHEGIRHRTALFPGRVSWMDVTAISQHYQSRSKGGHWGVLVAKGTGGLFIPDTFSIERSELVAVMTQRWQAALAAAARSDTAKPA